MSNKINILKYNNLYIKLKIKNLHNKNIIKNYNIYFLKLK